MEIPKLANYDAMIEAEVDALVEEVRAEAPAMIRGTELFTRAMEKLRERARIRMQRCTQIGIAGLLDVQAETNRECTTSTLKMLATDPRIRQQETPKHG